MNSMESYLEKLRNSIIQEDYPKVKKYSKKIYNMSKNKINEKTQEINTLNDLERDMEKDLNKESSSEDSYVENCLFSDDDR